MDWRRAKTILIITFILLNCFLGYQLQKAMKQRSQYIEVDKISDQQIQKLLAGNQIQFKAQKPKDIENMVVWKAKISDIPGWEKNANGVYVKTFSTPIDFQQNRKKLDAFLQTKVKHFSDYEFFQKSTHKITYLQQHNQKNIYDGKIEVFLEKGKIRSIKMIHYTVLEKIKTINITHFNNALYNLINYKTKNPKKIISEVKIGFHKRGYANDSMFLIPIWLFKMDGKYYYVNAANLGSLKKVEPATLLNG